MYKIGVVCLIFLLQTQLLHGQQVSAKDTKVISDFFGELNHEKDINKKILRYEQIYNYLKVDADFLEKSRDLVLKNIAAAYAQLSDFHSSAIWISKIKNPTIKCETTIYCAVMLYAAGNCTVAQEWLRTALDGLVKENILDHERNYMFAKALYKYLSWIPMKGNERELYIYLKYIYDANGKNFSTDVGYYWGENAFDANKLLFYNYAKILINMGEIKPAAQIVASAFQAGIVPDSIQPMIVRNFGNHLNFEKYLKSYKNTEKNNFQKSVEKLFFKKDANGKIWDKSAFKGKYLLLDFWGSWCLPCRFSHPYLKQVEVKYKAKGLEIIGIAIEMPKDLDQAKLKWKTAIAEDKIDWIHYLNNEDATIFDAVKSFGIGVFPTKIILDQQGQEIYRFTSGRSDKMDEALKKIFGF